MSIPVALPFPQALQALRLALAAEGLETASEWDAAFDLRTSMGPQLPDLRCISVFDPVALHYWANAANPTAALAILTLCDCGRFTQISISGHGTSYRKACRALARCRRGLPPLRHAA
jgi:hypothetical protein